MSYALLAGLPAVYGLYGAFVPVLVYALFGSCPNLAVGPVAVTSLLMGSALHEIYPASKNIDDPNDPGELGDVQKEYNAAAIQVCHVYSPLTCCLAAKVLHCPSHSLGLQNRQPPGYGR